MRVDPIYRDTARVIPVSPHGRVLLLCGHDPNSPTQSYWFTIGGQIEPGETARVAAVRELEEEVGIVIDESDLRGPFHHGELAYSLGGVDYHSTSAFFTVILDERRVQPAGLPGEIITDARWWDPADVWDAPVFNRHIPEIVAMAAATLRNSAG